MSEPTIEMPKDIEAEYNALTNAITTDPNEDRYRPDYHSDDYVRLLEERVAMDALTGVGTWRALNDRLHQILEKKARNLGFLFVDGNKFGIINKALSHEYGNEYVQQTAGLMKKNLDEKKSDIYRAGGDEFVVILRDVHSQDDIDAIGQRLASTFSGGNYETDGAIIPTVSIGGVFIGPDRNNNELERALVGANMAMKDAKAASDKREPVSTEFKQRDQLVTLRFPPTSYLPFQESLHGPLAALPRPKPFVAK